MKARRGLVHDVFVEGDQCAVYAGDQVVVLSPIATTVLLQLDEHWTPVPELVRAVESIYGPPPQGSTADAVARIMEELSSAHIVQLHAFGL
ncbi:hypothetical protein JNB_05380 [Janibacter sp. HTCC2649]|uniref:PqqD family protein n=1 Tax=Janibacter sp. HTCC2649 TaxID=313589 RepID=UPI000066ED8D|nr:PqqD family protein [Janibacter sp. HTCC2649]EAP99578.1 hypothetical protein JNB_05380 [Janibacter sp. HTCC2649]